MIDAAFPMTVVAADRLEKSLYELQELYRKHREYIRVKHKISSLEMDIIQLVVQGNRPKMKDVGRRFGVKLSTLTSVIDKMEEQKLVKRTPSRDDRRVVFLEVTRKGQKIFEDYSQYIATISRSVHTSMTEADFSAFVEGLELMSQLVATEPVLIPVQESVLA
jgi:DNA-binding MarR family transcriptional regulator